MKAVLFGFALQNGKMWKENWETRNNPELLKRNLGVCTHLLLLQIHFISYSYRKNWRIQLAKLNKDQSLTAASKNGTKIPNRRLLSRTEAAAPLCNTAPTIAPIIHPCNGSINTYFINAFDNNHTILTEGFAPGYFILLGTLLFAVNTEREIILNYLIFTSQNILGRKIYNTFLPSPNVKSNLG